MVRNVAKVIIIGLHYLHKTKMLHTKSDTFKEVPGCSQVYVTQNPAQVFLRTDSHTDCPKSVKFSCHECHDSNKVENRRKNTLSSGEVTVIVKHDFETLSGENNLKRQKYVTVTNIFR